MGGGWDTCDSCDSVSCVDVSSVVLCGAIDGETVLCSSGVVAVLTMSVLGISVIDCSSECVGGVEGCEWCEGGGEEAADPSSAVLAIS